MVLSLQQLKLIFDAIAGVRSSEFELLGEVRRALCGGGGGPGQDPTGQTSTSPPPRRPQGGGRRSCSAPPTPAPLPGPVFTAPGAAPALASCPRLSKGGGCARSRSSPATPAVGVRLKARPWWGQGAPSTAPPKRREGVHSERPVASGGRRTRPRETPPSWGGMRFPSLVPLGEGPLSPPEISGGAPLILSTLPLGRALPGGVRLGSPPTPGPRKHPQP